MGNGRNWWKRNVWRASAAILTLTLVLATSSSLRAEQEAIAATRIEARQIEGVWNPIVTIRDCETEAALFSFLSMDTYIQGGSYLGEGNGSPSVTGYGRWRHAGGRDYTSVFQFFTFNPDGSPAGRLKVSSRMRLSDDGTAFTAADTAEVTDLDGNVVGHACSTREATRLQ